ncbi:hypothetical protein BH09MYX1_BH09MYX1_37190 [soil metagenome]
MGRALSRSLAALFAAITAVALVSVSLASGLVGCETKTSTAGDVAPVVDTGVLAFLSLARAGHHEADILEEQGDVEGAIAAIQRIVNAPRPHAGETVPEVDETLADAYARLADLRLTKGDVDAAEKDVKEGLTHAKEATYFRGELLTTYGVVEQKRAQKLMAAGQTVDANNARTHAVSLLEEAMDIQEHVIGKTLGDGGDASAR